jgi:hypothetical protein
MTGWEALTPLRDILITYYFGSPVAYYTSIVFFVFLALIVAGLEIRMAVVLSLPLVATFAIYGVFGAYTWVANVMLLLVGIVYAYAIIELFT